VPNFVLSNSDRRPQRWKEGFRLHLADKVDYMAFDGQRILVATKTGLHSMTVRDHLHHEGSPDTPRVHQILQFPFNESLKTSCIQLLQGSAFLSYPVYFDGFRREYVAYVDFTDITPVPLGRIQPPLQATEPRENE